MGGKDVAAIGVAQLSSPDMSGYAPPKERRRPGPRATINAVIITQWAGKPVAAGEEVILLTPAYCQAGRSLPVSDPLAILDLYRRRAWIENELHRELKQG